MTPCVLVLNDIADDDIFRFTINVSCLVILFNSNFEVEVKCFKNHLKQDLLKAVNSGIIE